MGFGTAGALTYLGYLYYKRKKLEAGTTDLVDFPSPPSASDFTPPEHTNKAIGDGFPLRKGSRGPRVKALQSALIARYGRDILPKYGADGIFGSEVITALAKAGLPPEVNESAYNSFVSASRPDPAQVATALRQAILGKNFSQAMAMLQSMHTTDDYSTVSKEFLKSYISGVRKTLVNGLLDAGFSEDQKQQIRLQLTRMGLHFDGSKWSIPGLSGLPIVTNTDAVVWKDEFTPLAMPRGVILGHEIARDGEMVWFEQAGQPFLVRSTGVDYLRI